MQCPPQFVYMRTMSQEFHIAPGPITPDPDDVRLSRPVTGIDHDEDLGVVVVRTAGEIPA